MNRVDFAWLVVLAIVILVAGWLWVPDLFGRFDRVLERPEPVAAAPVAAEIPKAAAVPSPPGEEEAVAVVPVGRKPLEEGPGVVLAKGGAAQMDVVVAAGADEATREAAASLAEMLSKISGGSFQVVEGDGTTGLAVGTFADFPQLGLAEMFDAADPIRREEYVLRTHENGGVWLIGATPLGARHAVWDLLHELGYRQFFPGPTWEVIPEEPDLRIAVDRFASPDYIVRRIFYQYGSYRERALFDDWVKKNRAGLEGFNLRTSHIWQGIVNSNRELFLENPDWLAMRDGQRRSIFRSDDENRVVSTIKFNLGNPDLRKFLVQNALERLENLPDRDSITMDPSDGGGWCESEEANALGSISDQLVTAVNEVAEAISEVSPGTKVGIYAYHQHSLPPSIPVHPAVVVSVATNLTSGGLTTLQLKEGWRDQGATIGTRGYWSIYTWHRDLPGGSRAADPPTLAADLRRYHRAGSRLMIAEGADNWGPCGLGYYAGSRVMWDLSEENRLEEIEEDFLTRAFGPAKEPMRVFYRLLRGGRHRQPLSEDLVGRMFRALAEARVLTQDPSIQERLDDLVLYTRYVELYRAYAEAEGEERQKPFEEMSAHALRMRDRGMVHSMAVHRDLPRRDSNVSVPEEMVYNLRTRDTNPWLLQPPFNPAEIDRMVTEGIAANEPAPFESIAFSEDLVPALPLLETAGQEPVDLAEADPFRGGGRGNAFYYLWVPKGIDRVVVRSNAMRLYSLYHPESSEDPVSTVDLSEFRHEENPAERTIELPTTESGLHELRISGRFQPLEWTQEEVLVSVRSPGFPHAGASQYYFYVPKGTKVIGGSVPAGRGFIADANGTTLFDFKEVEGRRATHFSFPVPEGQDGKFWTAQNIAGLRLLTVPPYFARVPQQLLLPVEVVEADSR